MFIQPSKNISTIIIGGGCAGFSLARKADQLPAGVTVLLTGKTKRQDHSWGFFLNDDTADAAPMVRKTWPRWKIITETHDVTQSATHHPYAGLESKAWLTHCKDRAIAHGVQISPAHVDDVHGQTVTTTAGRLSAETIFDSRPTSPPNGMMIQSFIGHEVQTANPVFDPDCAVLMDFRCDQSRGIHFIYVLPYSDRQALIESTMFSPVIQDDEFYETAITRYLTDKLNVDQHITLRREKGAIPMGILPQADNGAIAIGGRGGAIRPSSGYAFSFIQRQVNQVLAGLPPLPHQSIDLLMDRIFLRVLKRFPRKAPQLFRRMAAALTGDEMARFMSGHADLKLRLKVIMAMPKWPFLRALLAKG